MELARLLFEEKSNLKTFAARGSVNYINGNSKHFFRFECLLRRSGGLVFTVFDPLGRPAMKVISDGTVFSALDYRSQVAMVGQATSDNLRRVLPVNIQTDDLTSVLTNSLLPNPSAAAVSRLKKGQISALEIVEQHDQGLVWLVSIDNRPAGPVITSQELGRPSDDNFKVFYSHFESLPIKGSSRDFPLTINVALDGERRFDVRYEQVILEPSLSDKLFDTNVPVGFMARDILDLEI
jgi:hypothetical protein